ncbi:MAG: hypothetical protein EOM20_00915 [Spartobacteria bacterium]|nr:hypothetical protein [Spartobacteria bacterium]
MKSNAEKLRRKTAQHKQSKRRKYVSKAKLLLPILGGLCLFLALLLLGLSFLMKTHVIRHRWLVAAAAYASIGILLVLIKYFLDLTIGWRARRRRVAYAGELPKE